MLNIYARIEEIEKLLQHEDILSYRIEINTTTKEYLIQKNENETVTVVGFRIPDKEE